MVIRKNEFIRKIDKYLLEYDKLKRTNFPAAIEQLKYIGELMRLMEEEDVFLVREFSKETH